jgi:fructan beta-fructosidase
MDLHAPGRDGPDGARLQTKISHSRTSGFMTKFSRIFLFAFALIFAAQGNAQQSAAPATSWQPQLHFSAPPNWINDPNGPIFLNGQYHLFFQLNPSGDLWGHMSWGHAVSTDLLQWKVLPVALREENGVAIFSGSTVEDRDNTSGLCAPAGQKSPGCLVAIYTGNSQEKQTQNIAYSTDAGTTWTKFASNPVIDLGLKDFRDPKVFWHAASASWVMVVALPNDHKVRFYRSANLRQWVAAGEFGPSGAVNGEWECPDLIELPVRDYDGNYIEKHWVLSVNVSKGGPNGGSADQYFVGAFDGSHFTLDHPYSGTHWADWGKDFYASTSFSNLPPDHDRLWMAWMDNWQYAAKLPSLPGRGEMTVARALSLRQPPSHPEPTPGQEPLTLVQKPVLPSPAHQKYRAMFGAPQYQTIEEANARLAKAKATGRVFELRFELDPGEAPEAGVRLRRSSSDPSEQAQEETLVGIDTGKSQIFIDRTRSGKTDWSPDFPARMSAPMRHSQAQTTRFDIVVDENSVEVFAEDGETVLSSLIFPSPDSVGLSFYVTPMPPGSEPARIRDLEVFPLGK